ncbi:hypothetical protein ISN44_As06g003550 [Arabidopsis suecica]|uniref:Uncharacterized protein n=1 Tax=Arabidopsis suecica TaxID=45249 RepID=A0A8T2C8F9_ARASU|nr:hypothetical protein ISN44_As06g003550 [Arabidopsis suecica]
MEGQTHDAQNNVPEHDNPLMNVKNPSSNLFSKKDAQCLSVLCNGKWLQIVRSSPKVSCEASTCPSHILTKVGENYVAESEKMHKKVISFSSKTFSQGTLQFTMRANGTPHFVFKLENQKDVYVASLSSNVQDQNSYMIHLQRGESSSSSSHLVGRINVSTLFSEKVLEREFVLFSSNGENLKIPRTRKNRGLSKKVVHAVKNERRTARLSRTSFIPDLGSWDEQFQAQNYDCLLKNKLPTNLETLAVVVKQETIEDEIGGWGLKFLKRSPMFQRSNDASETETSTSSISMNVVIPSGIHGGPEDGPSSLIERWKSQGNCDCGGWDLCCSLTLLKGQPRKDQYFELFIEGSKHETTGLKIVNVSGGLYLVQFEAKLTSLQSFAIALAFIHSEKLRPLHLYVF